MFEQMVEAVSNGSTAAKEKVFFGSMLTRQDAKVRVNADGTTTLYWEN